MSDTPKRILVIDDDPDIQAVLEVVLEDLGGYLVAACQSGPEVLVEAPGFAPDLILLDMMMPGLDGYDTAVRIRQLASRIPLLILTGQAEDDDPLLDAYARELGGTVLRKRMNPEALGQAIAGACGEALPVQWSASARLASRRPRGWHCSRATRCCCSGWRHWRAAITCS